MELPSVMNRPALVQTKTRLDSVSLLALAQLLLIVCVVALVIYRLSPPTAVPASAPPTEFSSGRAMTQLQTISQSPRPIGSQRHSEVREYLQRELTALGAAPEVVQSTAMDNSSAGLLRAATVHNIVARLPGSANSKAIMLTAHYDTVPGSPGASDDGAGVAAILETVRALKAGPQLKNDVIVLFTDGEEVGLLGARAFVGEHSLAKDVGVVLNLEARGSTGPVLMFETSNNNGWLVEEFAEAVPQPVSNSLFSEIYKLLPNETDMTVFKRANMAGLNFAHIDGEDHYHTSLDSITNIDERSLQHHGSYALALTRHLGELNLTDVRANDSVYFDLAGTAVVRYPKSLAIVLTVLALLFLAAIVFIGFRKKRLTLRGIALGTVATLVSMILAYGLTLLLLMLIDMLQPGNNELERSNLLFAGFIMLTVAIASASYTLFRGKAGTLNLLVGGVLWWFILLAVTTVYLPAASYIFMWPLFLTLAAVMVTLISNRPELSTWQSAALFSISVVAAVIIFAPIIYLVFIGISLSALPALMVAIAILLVLVVPTLGLIASPRKWLTPVVAAGAGAILIVAGCSVAAVTDRSPEPTNLFYGLNADNSLAVWGSADKQPDVWTTQFLSPDVERKRLAQFFPFGSREFLAKSAAPVPLAPPRAEILSDEKNGDVRHLKMRITSPREAPVISVYLDEAVNASKLVVNGKPVAGADETRWVIRYYALPPGGIELAFDVKSQKPIEVKLVDQSYGLPQSLTAGSRPKPDNLIPSTLPYSDSTMVSKAYNF